MKELGFAFSINVVLHRANLDRIGEIIELAAELGADRLELANTQYYGWGLENRRVAHADAGAGAGGARRSPRTRCSAIAGRMQIIVRAARLLRGATPRPATAAGASTTSWSSPGRHGAAVPRRHADHHARASTTCASIRCEWIWHESPAFQAFRGDDWMKEPCRSCPRKAVDFGGCRCQAFALTGDAANTDPVCTLSPHRAMSSTRRSTSTPATDEYRLPRSRTRAAARRERAARPAIQAEGSGATTARPGARRARRSTSPRGRAGRPARSERRRQDDGDAAAGHAARARPAARRASSATTSVARARAPSAAAGPRVPGDQRRRPADRRGEPAVRGPARGAGRTRGPARRSPRRIERAGLGPRAVQPARQLSGGWRRLADIARATLHQPDLLILDEPTVGLDPEHRERIWTHPRGRAPRARARRSSSPPTISPRPSRPTGWCCFARGGVVAERRTRRR